MSCMSDEQMGKKTKAGAEKVKEMGLQKSGNQRQSAGLHPAQTQPRLESGT